MLWRGKSSPPPLPESIHSQPVRGFNFIYSLAFVAWRHAKMRSQQGEAKSGMKYERRPAELRAQLEAYQLALTVITHRCRPNPLSLGFIIKIAPQFKSEFILIQFTN
jgi:hypothetical protein